MRRSTRLQGRVTVNFGEREEKSEVEDAAGTHNSERKLSSPSPSPAPDDPDEEYGDGADVAGEKESRKRKATTKGKGTKKAKTMPTAAAKPPPATDPSTWPESKIPEDATITKSDAVKRYRLNAKSDFEGLNSKKIRTGSGYTALLYRTRDVEHRAWEKHGSPEGFEYYLSKLKSLNQTLTSLKSLGRNMTTRWRALRNNSFLGCGRTSRTT